MHRFSVAVGLSLLAGIVLSGCASMLERDSDMRPEVAALTQAQVGIGNAAGRQNDRESPAAPEVVAQIDRPLATVENLPGTSMRRASVGGGATAPEFQGEAINATLPSQPLPEFINTVLGDILELPFALGPGVAERRDMVALRSVRDMPEEDFYRLFETAISDYGLALVYEQGLVQVVERSDLQQSRPEIIISRARPSVPSDLRPVLQFVRLDAIDAAEMEVFLRESFPGDEITISARRGLNALVLNGLSDVVDLAVELIAEMDRPRFAGAQAARISPENWEVAQLATTLSEILSLEGYQVSVGTRSPRPIALLPVGFTNQLLVFADTPQLMNRVIAVARELEDAAAVSDERTPHVYQVLNSNAQSLADVARAVLGEARQPTGGAGQAESLSSRIAVDASGNRLIFSGTVAEFDQLRSLFAQLDSPVPEVLVEVAIAEVTLSDSTRFGLEFLLNTFGGDLELRTAGGLGLENGGLSAVLTNGQVDISAAARATNSQINVLSTPRIVARSGSSASVQVGTDVPIITSQRAANTQQGGSSDILQSIQYRSTGVLLTVEPTVFSNNRIDLSITQEVSSALENPNQSIASPIISNRSLTSELTLQDGQTAILGGLMERRVNEGQTGVPILSDVPGFGSLFRTQSVSADQTVLLVLVTPYILVDRDDRQGVVEALGGELRRAFVTPIRTRGMIADQAEEISRRIDAGRDTSSPD